MNNKDVLDALHISQQELKVAHQATEMALLKVNSVISQLQENLRTQGELQPAQSSQYITTSAGEQMVRNTMAAASAEAAERLPTLDFSEALQAGVPQSPASAVKLPRSLQEAGQVSPTPELPAAAPAPAGPTLERAAPTLSVEQRKKEQLGHYAGVGSLFARYFSPEVISAGKGMLKPGVAGLQQYNEDITQLPLTTVEQWPTGFYRSSATSAQQLLVLTARAMVLLPSLAEAHTRLPQVALRPVMPRQPWQAVNELDLMDVLMIKDLLEGEFKRMTSLVQVG